MNTQITKEKIMSKINELGMKGIHDLYWSESIVGWNTILFYDVYEDIIDATAFTPNTTWNPHCGDIYLCSFDNFQYDNLFNYWDEIFTEEEMSAWDQDNEDVNEFAERMNIDLVNDRYYEASLFWFEDGWHELIEEIDDNLDDL